MQKTKLLFVLPFLFLSWNSKAQWTNDSTVNTKVRDTAGITGTETKVASAPNGNTFISWAENTSLGYRYRLQLLDVNGNRMWASNGLLIDSIQGSALYRYDMKVDLDGNAIVALQDNRSAGTNIPVVFKVDQSGTMVWGQLGIQLNDTAQLSGLSPTIGITGGNNVIVAWSASNGSRTFVSAQKFTPAGVAIWGDNLRIRNTAVATEKYERPQIIRSSGENMLIQYVLRTGSGLGVSTMYAQLFNATGTPQWTVPTKVSTKTIGFAYFPAPISDGYGGFFVTYTTSNPTSAAISDVYGQRVYPDGHIWSPEGVELSSGATLQKFEAGAAFVPSQNAYYGGIKITNSGQSAAGIAIQKLDTAGTILLSNPAPVLVPLSSGVAADIINVTGTKDVGDGLMVVYQIGSFPSPISIRAVKSDYTGNLPLANAIPVSTIVSDKTKYAVGDFSQNQLVVGWNDNRNGNAGVYAQNIKKSGSIGPCPIITIAPATLATDTIGRAFTTTLSQTGGTGATTYTVTTGTLPAGLTLSTAGVLSGTPTATGVTTFTVTAQDANGCTGIKSYTFTSICQQIQVSGLITNDTVGKAVNVTMTQANGAPGAIVYSSTGTLPTGLTLSATGVLSGTVTTSGSYTFTITATDVNGCTGSITYTNIVYNCPTVSQPALAATCDTIQIYTLTGGYPAGGTYSGANVTGGVFNPQAAGAGTHTIRYKFTTGNCEDSVTQTILVNTCRPSGVQIIPENRLATIYPNPAHNSITVAIGNLSSGKVSIRMMSITGQVLFAETQKTNGGQFNKVYDLTKYPSGMYLVEVSCNKGTERVPVTLQ